MRETGYKYDDSRLARRLKLTGTVLVKHAIPMSRLRPFILFCLQYASKKKSEFMTLLSVKRLKQDWYYTFEKKNILFSEK